MMLGKLQRAHPTLHGYFAPAYLVGSNMLGAYLFFIYGRKEPKIINFYRWNMYTIKSLACSKRFWSLEPYKLWQWIVVYNNRVECNKVIKV